MHVFTILCTRKLHIKTLRIYNTPKPRLPLPNPSPSSDDNCDACKYVGRKLRHCNHGNDPHRTMRLFADANAEKDVGLNCHHGAGRPPFPSRWTFSTVLKCRVVYAHLHFKIYIYADFNRRLIHLSPDSSR